MYITATEEDRLRIFVAAELARRSRTDGLKLNAPEVTALICDEMHRAARAGASREEVLAAGRAAVGLGEIMDGVAALVPEIRLEVLLADGTRLVVLREPWGQAPPGGDSAIFPGEIRSPDRDVMLSPGNERLSMLVTNASTHPVRVSSHYPFWRVNRRLDFDRAAARGYRLDLPAGSSIRWAPGEARQVDLVRYSGNSGDR
ncbi:MAG TPA: urease subunit beta [Streptosporangiaceae bacterium]|nr:urease subunit beta [Streptosporangiaceae bacterium]